MAPLSAPLLARMELLPGAIDLAPRFSRLQQQIERQQWDEAADQLLELMQMLIEQQLAGQDWSALLRGLIRQGRVDRLGRLIQLLCPVGGFSVIGKGTAITITFQADDTMLFSCEL